MNKEKHVDESWKEQATQEKDVLAEESSQQADQAQAPTEDTSAEKSNQAPQQTQSTEGDAEQAQAVEINFLNYIFRENFYEFIPVRRRNKYNPICI